MYGKYTTGRHLAKFTIACVLGIFFGEWWVYHISCKPVFIWAVAFNGCLALAVWSYLATALTDPGTHESPEWQAWSANRGKHITASEDRDTRSHGWMPGEASWCRNCGRERPERAHHCSQCGVCVLRMDHHCPWVGTCIGWRNHKYFILLNWWSFLASVVFLISLRQPYAVEALSIMDNVEQDVSLLPTIGVLSVLLFLLITGGMFAFSLTMLMRNITAVEELFPDENPYRLPSLLDNATQALGPVDLRIFLPIEPERHCSGTAFPVRKPLAAAGTDQRGIPKANISSSEVRVRAAGRNDAQEQLISGAVRGESSYGSVV